MNTIIDAIFGLICLVLFELLGARIALESAAVDYTPGMLLGLGIMAVAFVAFLAGIADMTRREKP